jgi:hypothetical protein
MAKGPAAEDLICGSHGGLNDSKIHRYYLCLLPSLLYHSLPGTEN